MLKPYAAACNNNRQPILEVIEVLFAGCREVLEIGTGIRNFEEVDQLANEADLYLRDDYAMPANNRLICWVKRQQTTLP